MKFLLDNLKGLQVILDKNIMPLNELLALPTKGFEILLSEPESPLTQDFIATPRR